MRASTVTRQVTMRVATLDDYPVRAVLCYDREDPWAVTVNFGRMADSDDDNVWAFSRDLLVRGLREHAGCGDVRVWPFGGDRLMMRLSSPGASVLFSAVADSVRSFLLATYRIVPAGRESEYVDVDACITKLLAAQS